MLEYITYLCCYTFLKEADIGAAGFSVTYERATVVDFTFAFHQEPSAILIPPPTEGEKLTVLIRPLSKQVRCDSGLTLLIVSNQTA